MICYGKGCPEAKGLKDKPNDTTLSSQELRLQVSHHFWQDTLLTLYTPFRVAMSTCPSPSTAVTVEAHPTHSQAPSVKTSEQDIQVKPFFWDSELTQSHFPLRHLYLTVPKAPQTEIQFLIFPSNPCPHCLSDPALPGSHITAQAITWTPSATD